MTTPRDPSPRAPGATRIHPAVERAAAYGWRLAVIVGVLVGLLWLLAELWVVVLALVVALYMARALDSTARYLRAHSFPPALAALSAVLLFLAALTALGWLLIPRLAEEFGSLGPTLSEAVDDLETWIVDDSPFALDRGDVADLRERISSSLGTAIESSTGLLVSGAVAVVEGLTGLILAVVTTFFILKDGPRFQSWVIASVPEPRRELVSRTGATAWTTIGAYLRGVAILGGLEGTVIGATIAIVGGRLAVPVAVITFVAAFVPMVGAVIAGVIAVLVTLTTAGPGAALIVGIVALVVQQLDNDLLAPVIYGRSLQLHPLVVLFSVVSGSALFGLGGAVLAVPTVAVALNVIAEARAVRGGAPSVFDNAPAEPAGET